VRIRIKRAYDAAEPGDGYRILIDHVWPRGISRERAHLDEWARELAPSDGLRKWFDHEPVRFARFRARYRQELAGHADRVDALRERAAHAPLKASRSPPADRCRIRASHPSRRLTGSARPSTPGPGSRNSGYSPSQDGWKGRSSPGRDVA
jgi:uncharacterized protein YeaO (DUF488 family)